MNEELKEIVELSAVFVERLSIRRKLRQAYLLETDKKLSMQKLKSFGNCHVDLLTLKTKIKWLKS